MRSFSRHLFCLLLIVAFLAEPALAYAGEKDVKASFLLVGGVGGILIGAGLYVGLLVLAAGWVKRRAVRVSLVALAVGSYLYIQYWSCYFLAIATRFLRTRQMHYEFGELTPLLACTVLSLGLWGIGALVLARRLARRPPGRL
ncbi:hypothetical protein [Hymenobacter cellulosivorans]|uniref:DUF4293 family protein n=1 Tax=Hymenobacter cellulosivorans TaxID=2932249 RepID=A0ABY4FC69_9BACT|nr:hypothetical protein [Hymenobacter cellulosivorans]UOQ53682.1 hypothetical protein MUN80_02735 [Hymenobacter cellulosivorans]